MISSLMLALVLLSEPKDDQLIIDTIKGAIATNAAFVQSGSLEFDVSQTIEGLHPVRAMGHFTWSGTDGFWACRLSDPDHIATGRGTYTRSIAEASVEYKLLSKDKFYSYYASNSSLHVYEYKNRYLSTFYLFDLYPTTLWDQCCAPLQGRGRPWSEMIDANSLASQPDSTHQIIQVGNKEYKHIRVDPKFGTMRTTYSLEYGGHVVEHDYDFSNGKGESKHILYEWDKIGRAVVLKRCEARKMFADDPKRPKSTFVVNISKVDLATRVPHSKLTLESFSDLLPSNTFVNDHINTKTYSLHRSNKYSDEALKDLAKKVRSGSLLKGGNR